MLMFRTWKLGIKSLLLHPMRSALTVLGIFIGVASVIWLLAIGEGISAGKEEIAAEGLTVTPAFIDVHAHLDGNVTWESALKPATGHGIGTAVMGNCGVGFAPCLPEHRDDLTVVGVARPS